MKEEAVVMTEAEKIEFSRRWSEVNSVIQASHRLFAPFAELKEQAAECKKITEGVWFWLVFISACVLGGIFKDSFFDINIFGVIALGCGVVYVFNQLKLFSVDKKLNAFTEKLYDLDRIWFAAVGENTFWEMEKHIEDLSMFDYDLMNVDAVQWSLKQRDYIIGTVCGWEKAHRIAEYETKVLQSLK